MASYGPDNWERNWKGSDHQTFIKKSASAYYRKNKNNTFSRIGNLNEGTQVTYIDSETKSYTKAAIKLPNNDDIYYIHIDKLDKPKKNSRSSISLNPESFGLENQTYASATTYYNSVVSALNLRDDIDGELFDYLHQLLNYVKTGSHDYDGINMSGFPWGPLMKDFGEVIGPIACVKRGILNQIITTVGLTSPKIYIPPSREAVYDYKIIIGSTEHLISAKSGRGVSNQVKPQYVIPVVQDKLSGILLISEAYKLLKILSNYSIKQGPFYGWQLLQTRGELTNAAINDMETNYAPRNKKGSSIIVDYESWKPFLKRYFSGRKRVTYGEVRYKCEQLIESESKVGVLNQNLRKIFNVYLSESRIIYVKTTINARTGFPTITASSGGGSSVVRRLYLRSSNSSPKRTGDKIGFQIS